MTGRVTDVLKSQPTSSGYALVDEDEDEDDHDADKNSPYEQQDPDVLAWNSHRSCSSENWRENTDNHIKPIKQTRKQLNRCFSVWNAVCRKEGHSPLPLFVRWLSHKVILVLTEAVWIKLVHLWGFNLCEDVRENNLMCRFLISAETFSWHQL